MSGAEYLLDTDLNPESYLALNLRETFNQSYVYGEKLSPDGSLLFAPSVNAIDVFDGRIGTLLHRIALPISLCPNYDALVSDGKDNILVAITGQNGDESYRGHVRGPHFGFFGGRLFRPRRGRR